MNNIVKGLLSSIIGSPLGAKQYYRKQFEKKEIEKEINTLKSTVDGAEIDKELIFSIDPKINYYVLKGESMRTIPGEVLKTVLEKNADSYDKIAPYKLKHNYDKYFLFSNDKKKTGLYEILSFEKEADAINIAKSMNEKVYKVSPTGKFNQILF